MCLILFVIFCFSFVQVLSNFFSFLSSFSVSVMIKLKFINQNCLKRVFMLNFFLNSGIKTEERARNTQTLSRKDKIKMIRTGTLAKGHGLSLIKSFVENIKFKKYFNDVFLSFFLLLFLCLYFCRKRLTNSKLI